MKTYNVGVIGTGMICRIYIDNIAKRFEIVELKAVADIALEKAEEVAKIYGVKACTVDELLDTLAADYLPAPELRDVVPRSIVESFLQRMRISGMIFEEEK